MTDQGPPWTDQLDPDTSAQLARVLGCTSGDPSFVERVDAFARKAFDEYVDWALARQRYSGVGEIDRFRVTKIFLEIRQEPITVERLVEELSFPEGRAIAMASRMRYGEARKLRALERAAAATEVEEAFARQPSAEDNTSMSLRLSRESARALTDVAAALASNDTEVDTSFPNVQPQGRTSRVTTKTKIWKRLILALRDEPATDGAE